MANRKKFVAIILLLIAGPLAWYGMDKLANAYPTKFLCGKIITRPEKAIEAAAKSIIGWDKALLNGLTPLEYVKKAGACCWASLRESLHGNWMVSITLPTRCGNSKEAIFGVLVCGGGSWIIGSAPSSDLFSMPETDTACH